MGIKKGKRGSILMMVATAVIIFMVGMIAVNFIKPEVTTARTSLNCGNAAAITDGAKLMCLATDTVVPYFIILVCSIAGGILTEKLLV